MKDIQQKAAAEMRAAKYPSQIINIYRMLAGLKKKNQIVNVTIEQATSNRYSCTIEHCFGGTYKLMLETEIFEGMTASMMQHFCKMLEVPEPGLKVKHLPSVTHAKLHKFNTFTVGQFATVMYNESGHEFAIGTIVEITDIETGHYVCKNSTGEFWYLEGYELEPANLQKVAC